MTENDYIYEVYKERSFSAAAKKLFISQPALSASVKKVEERLGFIIFDRSTSPISVTQEGQIYIESLEKIRRINAETLTRLSDVAKLKYGHLTICGYNFISSLILPKIIFEFTKKYPGITVEHISTAATNLSNLILNETADIIITQITDNDLFEYEPLFNETLLLGVPTAFKINDSLKEYQITKQEVINGKHLREDIPIVDIKLFKDEPFILLKQSNDTYKRAKRLFDDNDMKPSNVVLYVDQHLTSHNMACAGIGVILVSDEVVKLSKRQGLVFYKLDNKYASRTMHIAYKKNRYVSKAMQEFINIAKEVYKRN